MRRLDSDFDEFAEGQATRLLGLAYLLTANVETAWDLVDVALLRVGPRWRRLRGEDPGAYARTVLVRLHLRRPGSARPDEPDQRTRRRDVPVVRDGPSHDWLLEGLQRLSPPQRAAVALSLGADLDIARMSREMGCSAAAAARHLALGLEALQSEGSPTRDLSAACEDLARSVRVSVSIAPRLAAELAAKRRGRVRLAAATVTTLVSVGVVTQVVSSAHDSAPDPRADQRLGTMDRYLHPPLRSQWAWEMSIVAYQNRLLGAGARHANYSGSVLDAAHHTLVVYGTGRPTADVAAVLNTPPSHLDAYWSTVPYSLAQLQDAAAAITRTVPGVRLVLFAPDYSSLILGLHRLPATESGRQHLQLLAHTVTRIPVSLRLDNREPA